MHVKARKKLIEVALPLDAINKACKDDKDRKTGHIRNLHKWYAPMPLPAWRAALFASIIDDPSASSDDESMAAARREELFQVLKPILPLDAAKSPPMFGPIKELLRNATGGAVPTVLDPFCGGGSTLLEAQRLGLRAIGSDLNPIPVLITTVLTRYPSLFKDVAPVNPVSTKERLLNALQSKPLVEDVLYYADLVGRRAYEELAEFYPKLVITSGKGRSQTAVVMSWIWSRTVQCPNPACGIVTPLASSFELTRPGKKGAGGTWIEPKIVENSRGRKIEYDVLTGNGPAPRPPKLGRGAKFVCLSCGNVISETQLRSTAQSAGLGFELMACVARASDGSRLYLPPTDDVLQTVVSPARGWEPELELSTHPQYMGAPRYGMRQFADLFTARQLKAIEVFARNVRAVREDVRNDAGPSLGERASAYADAVVTILALLVSKLSQSHNVLVRWKLDSRNGSGKPLPAFDTQTVPAVWDFVENNPFGGSVGDWLKTVVPTGLRAFDYCVAEALPSEISQVDARSAVELCRWPVIIATDPPYYDNVPYADLSDVFYPTLRFILQDVHPALFQTLRAPRSDELVADYYRMGGSRDRARQYYLEGFRTVFSRLKDRIRDDTPMTVVYSFKQQEDRGEQGIASTGWEVMIRALLDSGFTITATWPIRTTLENRSRDIDSNALASAILIVCRPRPDVAGTATRREFVAELRNELPGAVRRLQISSIAPVDLQQAMIGPGIAVFSKYSEVVDVSGASLSVHDALTLINATLDEVLAEQEGDFDADSRWAISWFEQVGFDEGEYGVAETLSKAKNTSVAGLSEAGILLSKRGRVRLLKPEELPANWDPEKDSRLTVWEIVNQLVRTLGTGGERAAADLVAKLGGRAEAARELAYRLFTICERKKRATEALFYNGLVQSWPEIARLAQEGSKRQPTLPGMVEAVEP